VPTPVFRRTEMTPHEFGYLVELSVAQMAAIVTAMSTAAEVLGEQEAPGQLTAAFTADVVAVKGNPLEDIVVTIFVSYFWFA